ncbi:nucleoside deaminase [Candidatus Woesearchaeota archaeon]|nr:MAG: nucleoside deaminase [Candidatus Woesearchaeota archaeon]
MKHPDKEVMLKAIALAKKKRSVACFIVKGDKVIARAVTTVHYVNLPTRHAEINAIEKACKKLGSLYLKGCWLYSTFEPCPMCAAACVWAKLKGVVFGANMSDRTKNFDQRVLISCESVLKQGSPKLRLYKNFLRKECKKVMF